MKQKTGRKLLSFLLTLAMVVGLMPGMGLTAYAATDTYTNLIPTDSDTDLSAKQVNFNGYKWYIIADNSTAANAGSVTLFAAEKIGTSQFYTSKNVATAQSYNGSTVKAYLDSLTTGEGSFAAFADAIIPTNLTTYKFNSSEVYETTENAKLYLLSVSEASELPTNVRKSETYWWLRSPGTYSKYDNEYYAAVVSYATGEVDKNGYWVTMTNDVRPALKLDLSKVTFDSTSKTFSLKSVASVTSGETTTEYAAFSEALNAWTDGSTLTLLADAEITKTINVSGTKTLDLNGYGIKATGTGYSVITVGSGANLTLNDTGSDTTGYITGGVASFGGGININGGTVKMNGGNLTGNTASGSGSSGRGGGVYVINGSFELRYGIIEGNKATNGGGVAIGSSGTFTMSGGVIQYNDGLSGGVLLTQAKDFTISGGAIQYNAGSAFGGIGIDGNLTIQMSGAPVIKGNVVFSDTNGKITKTDSGYTLAEGGTPSDVRQLNKHLKININSALTSGAAIGISQPYTFTQTDAFTTGFKTYHSGNEATEFFFSNDARTVIAKDANGELIIANACTVTFNANGHGTEPASATVASGSVITAPTAPTADGYTFGGWYKEQGCTNEWNFASDTVTAATTLYAKWTPVAATAPTINSVTGAVLTVGYTEGSVSVSATVATDTTYNSLTYQWYSNTTNSNSNGTEISGATSASYAVPTGKAAGATEYYYCVVTATRTDNSQTATATSDVATVTVNEKGTQTITASDVAATYGDSDKKVEAATDGNGAISYAVKDGSAEYIDVDASTGALTIKKAGTATVVVTAAETSTYAQATKEVTVTINKANAVAATVTANNRTYDRTDKPLVTVDNSTLAGGKMQYALGTATEATQPYTTSIPSKTDAGTYYVWYKVVGDENHNNSEAEIVTVTVSQASIENAVITLDKTDLVCTGSEQSVHVSSVKIGETVLEANIDYEVAGTTGTNKGEYTVTVTGKGNYKDAATTQWNISVATPVIDVLPSASAITYGQSLSDSTLTKGTAKLGENVVEGTFSWKDDTVKPAVSDSEKTEYVVVFTPNDSANYSTVECKVKVTVNKALSGVAKAPIANTLIYNRQAQELVKAGEATNGTMSYAIGKDDTTTPAEGWSTSIPTATDAGTYYVWYKVVGNENYNDTKADVVTVTIKSYVTITFDSNGGSEVDPQVIDKGGKAEEPEKPVNGKLTFIGWFIDPTIETLYDIDNDRVNSFDFSSSVEKDTKLTAVWTAYAKVNTIGTGKVNFAYEGEEKDDEYDDSIILSAIQGMADTFILTAKADEGSRFVKWQKVIEEGETVEDSTFEDYSEDEEITIIITEPISLVAVFEAVDEDDKEYSSYESDTEWTKGSGMTFRAGAKGNKDDEDTLDHFTGLKGDGKLIDTKYYTAKKGSVKIELAPEYLETLEAGKHILTFMFDDAADLDVEFTVLAEEAGDDTEEETTEEATDETSEEGSTDETEKETTEETEEASEDRTEETEEASEDNTTEDSEGVSEDVSEDSASVDESTENTAKDAEIEVDDNTGTTEAKGDSSAKTGDNAPLLLVFLIMIDSALALNFVFLKKRKSGKNK